MTFDPQSEKVNVAGTWTVNTYSEDGVSYELMKISNSEMQTN